MEVQDAIQKHRTEHEQERKSILQLTLSKLNL